MNRQTYDRIMSSEDSKDHIALGCNECDAYITNGQMDADPSAGIDWRDMGDDGVLCPNCKYDEILEADE